MQFLAFASAPSCCSFLKAAMNARMNKRRIYTLFYLRFHGQCMWRSAEEQAWLDVAPVGREFGSPDYERLETLDLYAAGQMSREEAMRKLGMDGLEDLHQQMRAEGLAAPQAGALAARSVTP